eukprot:842679_1
MNCDFLSSIVVSSLVGLCFAKFEFIGIFIDSLLRLGDISSIHQMILIASFTSMALLFWIFFIIPTEKLAVESFLSFPDDAYMRAQTSGKQTHAPPFKTDSQIRRGSRAYQEFLEKSLQHGYTG